MISRSALLRFACVSLVLVLTACAQPGSNGGGPRTSTADVPESAPAPNRSAPTTSAMGTVTGGGGNGLGNQALESFSKKIDELPEYKLYIAPILNRMALGKPDILLAYLNWAVSRKAWLFLPTEFEQLSKEQVGVSFASSQLARNYLKEVHINAKRYNAEKDGRKRADLLMHEMVMSARLLMKQPAQFQCEALNQGDEKQCRSTEMLKLARQASFDETARKTLDSADHEAVRALNVFLMSKDQDLSGPSISLTRRHLGFDFPWDQLESNVSLADLIDAIQRAQHAGASYVATEVDASEGSIQNDCLMFASYYSYGDRSQASIFFYVLFPENHTPNDKEKSIAYAPSQTGPVTVVPKRYVRMSTEHWTDESSVEARGIRDPRNEDQMVDVVRVTPKINAYSYAQRKDLAILEFYLSRDSKPVLLEARSIAVSLMHRNGELDESGSNVELVPKREKPVVCRLRE